MRVVQPDVTRGSILIVDDREANILLLKGILRNAGYLSIATTMNPNEVCALHKRNTFELILLDLEMPGLDGFQVMDGLKEIEPHGFLPVLAITANPDHKLRALRSGARDFISKPFDAEELLLRVHNLLEVRLLHEAVRNNERLLESLARHDPLTGLANRRLLTERMTMALAQARRRHRSMAVVYLDLDGFKQVNDTFGHGVGDILLKTVAERLAAMVREEDTVARIGGDEFLFILSEIQDAGCAEIVAAKAIEVISKPFLIEGNTIGITTSVGIGIFPNHGDEADTLMKNADQALLEAKRAGRNTYRVCEFEEPSGNTRIRHCHPASGGALPYLLAE
jgi:diguanylate cyclase (GGDEF)-like protein